MHTNSRREVKNTTLNGKCKFNQGLPNNCVLPGIDKRAAELQTESVVM